MAGFDYQEFIDLAIELTSDEGEDGFGRAITLVELGDADESPSEPWLGSSTPRTVVKQSVAATAVFVEPSSLDALGRDASVMEFVKVSTQIAIMYSAVPLDSFDEVIDSSDGSRWKITGFSELKPGPVRVLFYVGLKR